jgi:hypothetical protein
MTALFVIGVLLGGTTPASAQSRSVYRMDPYDVQPMYGAQPTISATNFWQYDPFSVGYNLLGGYRPVYSGARQSVGHEIIYTEPNGNGYVYRPVYAPSPGYRYSQGGALIVEYRRRYPDSVNPTMPFAPLLEERPIEELPVPVAPRRSGPREF